MNNPWKVFSLALITGLLLGTAFGLLSSRFPCKRIGDMRGHPKNMVDRFSKALDLTADQQTKVAAIMEAHRAKMDALRDEAKPKFEALRQSLREEIQKVLTPEQMKKFDAFEKRMHGREGKMGGPGMKGMRMGAGMGMGMGMGMQGCRPEGCPPEACSPEACPPQGPSNE